MTSVERDAVIGRIKISTDLKDMAGADFVVEAATMAPSSPYWTHVDMVVSNCAARTTPR
jgi:hypothetical protein